MPYGKHLAGANPKQQRQYEHIKESELQAGRSVEEAKRIAAATVNKGKVLGEDHMSRYIEKHGGCC